MMTKTEMKPFKSILFKKVDVQKRFIKITVKQSLQKFSNIDFLKHRNKTELSVYKLLSQKRFQHSFKLAILLIYTLSKIASTFIQKL